MRGPATSVVLIVLSSLIVRSAHGQAANWPQFRGPTGLGYTDDRSLPIEWGGPKLTNVVYQVALPGEGHAGPIVWRDRVFVSAVAWKPGTTDRAKAMPDHHVTCFRASDGRMLWDTLVAPGPWLRDDFRSGAGGGYAAPTPTTDGQRVYCAFGSAVVVALDFQGKIVWRKEIIPYTFDVTFASSPVLFDDTVILFCPSTEPDDSRVVALRKTDGSVKWQEKLPEMGFGHSTPVIIRAGGRSQMLLVASAMARSGKALRSLDPANGKLLWWCRGAGDAASPAYGGGLVYFDSGRGSEGIAVDPNGEGDLSATNIRWTVNGLNEAISSPIAVEDYLYRLVAPGYLRCWEIATGRPVYSERLEGISSCWASPVADGMGRLYFASSGRSYVVQAGPTFRVLAVNDLGDPNHASPAVAGGRLYLVGLKKLWCIGRQ